MGVNVTRSSLVYVALAGVLALGACSDEATGPERMRQNDPRPASIVVTPGLSVYTDRAAWEAAVATAGGTVADMDFTGLTTGRVTQLSTDYGLFKIEVDRVSASASSNPGIDIIPDLSCSLGSGDCELFTLNMIDPTSSLDAPKFNKLIFSQNVIAFGGDFIQLGMTAPPPGSVTGNVTLRIGSESVVVNSYLNADGNGFFGFVATAADTITFTFLKSASLQNDIFQIYNPSYADAPASEPGTPSQMIAALRETIAGMSLNDGIARSLDSKLSSALKALVKDKVKNKSVCSALQDVIKEVSAQRSKKLSAVDADAIIAAVTAIKVELGC